MSLRDLPSVDHLLQSERGTKLVSIYGHPLTAEAIRSTLDAARAAIRDGGQTPSLPLLLSTIEQTLEDWVEPSLRSIINATGVILHTNLGRAPLSHAAHQAIQEVAQSYSTLEYDLPRGKRGKREQHVESLLTQVTGAAAGLVVNNNAAAVLLALTALARRKEVIVSRTQLIEIGGGFRVPDVMKQSGAKLIEVGTTNRTHLRDYEAALHDRTGLILRAHHSNFRIIGFSTEPSLAELCDLGTQHSVPVVDDLGSGALIDTSQFGLGHEPMVQESLLAGASLVAFSGDKLLGGPQAGILVGEKTLVDRLRRHPLARALRPDKLCLAALGATLTHYLKDEAISQIPVWQMIATSAEQIKVRSASWLKRVKTGELIPGHSTVGGGSLPEETLPTWLLALNVRHPNAFTSRLRQFDPPIIARIEDDRVVLDPRTVLVEQEEDLLESLSQILVGSGNRD